MKPPCELNLLCVYTTAESRVKIWPVKVQQLSLQAQQMATQDRLIGFYDQIREIPHQSISLDLTDKILNRLSIFR